MCKGASKYLVKKTSAKLGASVPAIGLKLPFAISQVSIASSRVGVATLNNDRVAGTVVGLN